MPSSREFWSSRCPLRDRARWASAEEALGGAYATTAGSGFDATTVVCDPSLAATLLREHDGEAGGFGKPDKSTGGPIGELLRHSLTNAPPGAEWRRQRSACEKALGSVGRLARSADAFAVAAARDAVATLSPAGTGSREVDLKPAVYACAARVMSLIVVGEAHAGTVADALLDVWRRGRVAVGEMDRGTAAAAARRLRVAGSAAAADAARDEATEPNSIPPIDDAPIDQPLLVELLRQPELTFAEAESNAHSFLLAGFETTAVVALFALLHLAHDHACQSACAADAVNVSRCESSPLVRAVIEETLRLYPPVLSLPRVVRDPGGLTIPDEGGVKKVLPGARMTVCSAAASFLRWPDAHRWIPARHLKPPFEGGGDVRVPGAGKEAKRPTIVAFGGWAAAVPRRLAATRVARKIVETILADVVLSPPQGAPKDGVDVRTARGGCCWPPRGLEGVDESPRYYWERRLVQTPVLLLTDAATVTAMRLSTKERNGRPIVHQERTRI